MFFLFRKVTLICRTMNLSRIGQNREYWSLNARFSCNSEGKPAQKLLIWWKLKNSYFSHKSGLQWPVMNKWKPIIYFQTKSDFLDTLLLSGSLCLPQLRCPYWLRWTGMTSFPSTMYYRVPHGKVYILNWLTDFVKRRFWYPEIGYFLLLQSVFVFFLRLKSELLVNLQICSKNW